MKYVGMYTQVSRNNRLTFFLLLMFPILLLSMVWLYLVLLSYCGIEDNSKYIDVGSDVNWASVNKDFLCSLPWVVGIVGVWFIIAYFFNAWMVKKATGAKPLERRENPRVYNIVENLTMTAGMDMPKINIVDDPQLNAFASGIDRKSYTVTVTKGLLNVLNDEELEGVIAHELTHIRNRDTRLLITSIIFVGIITTVMNVCIRSLYWITSDDSSSSSDDDDNKGGVLLAFLIAIILCLIAYVFAIMTRFAISRKREYMADAGGAELCGNPRALASALRKISEKPGLYKVKRDDVAQLFIIHPQGLKGKRGWSFFASLFSTHPDTEERIKILEQF